LKEDQNARTFTTTRVSRVIVNWAPLAAAPALEVEVAATVTLVVEGRLEEVVVAKDVEYVGVPVEMLVEAV